MRQLSDPVYGEGCRPARVCFVGEAPGIDEAKSGRPFVGSSGQLLRNLLRWVGIDPGLCWITNVCKVWPGRGEDGKDNAPTPAMIAEWTPFLVQELEEVQPEIVVGVGRLASEWLLGRPVTMKISHGIAEDGADLHVRTGWGFDKPPLVVPVMHPASVLHDPAAGPALVWDMQHLGKIVKYGEHILELAHRSHTKSAETPTKVVKSAPLAGWLQSSKESLIGMDTEGTPDAPWCASMSDYPGLAWVARAGVEVLPNRRLDRIVLFHYSVWDIPVVRALGIDLSSCTIRDTCVAAYNLQTEPQGLKELVARHYHKDMPHYKEVVAPWVEKARLAMLEKAWVKIQADQPLPPPKVRKKPPKSQPASA